MGRGYSNSRKEGFVFDTLKEIQEEIDKLVKCLQELRAKKRMILDRGRTKEYRKERKEMGICLRCPKKRGSGGSNTLCKNCLWKAKQEARERYRRAREENK